MPKKITAKALGEILTPGDILCTSFPGSSLLAKAIGIGQSLASGAAAIYGHAMRFIGNGEVISQEWRVVRKPLSAWSGCTVCRLHNPTYTKEQQADLVWLAERNIKRLYDVPGLVGQGLRGLVSWIPWIGPKLGNEAARIFQVPWLTYCIEMVAENERRVDPGFMKGTPKPNPDETVVWCRADGWLVEVYELEG